MTPAESKVTGSSPFEEGIGPGVAYLGFRLAAWLAENLPRSVGDAVASAGSIAWYRLSRGRREVVLRNLTRVVGPRPQIDDMVRRAFISYGEYWLETFRLGRYTVEDLNRMVDVDEASMKAMHEALDEKRGVLVITPHFGFYDLGSAWMGAQGWPFSTVTEVLRPRALYEWFTALRSKWGMKVIPAERGQLARRLGKILANGEGLSLVSDRDLGRRGIWAEFFGERTTLPATPALLMARRNIPVLAGAMYKSEGRLKVVFEPVAYERTGIEQDDMSSCAQVVATALEGLIRRAPEQWHLFMTNWPSDEPGLPARGRPDE